MDNHRIFQPRRLFAGFPVLLAVVIFSIASQAGAQQQPTQPQQQPKLSESYARAAFASLLAIEFDSSAAQDHAGNAVSATEQAIDDAAALAVTSQDQAVVRLLRQIYRAKLHDNNLVKAYRTVMEIESDHDSSNSALAKEKDDNIAQLADSEAGIARRESDCFLRLEDSLRQRSPEPLPACSDWVRKAAIAEKGSAISFISNAANSSSAAHPGL